MKIDDHINPLKIQLEEVKNKLKSQNAKIYGLFYLNKKTKLIRFIIYHLLIYILY